MRFTLKTDPSTLSGSYYSTEVSTLGGESFLSIPETVKVNTDTASLENLLSSVTLAWLLVRRENEAHKHLVSPPYYNSWKRLDSEFTATILEVAEGSYEETRAREELTRILERIEGATRLSVDAIIASPYYSGAREAPSETKEEGFFKKEALSASEVKEVLSEPDPETAIKKSKGFLSFFRKALG